VWKLYAVSKEKQVVDFLWGKSYILCPLAVMIAENVARIRERIRKACERSGRNAEDVRLVAVSKTFEASLIGEAVEAGLQDIGENLVQELRQKREALNNPGIRWHFVGHLQSNKVKYIADFIHLIHSLDHWSVAEEIDKRGAKLGRVIEALVEVNTSGEKTKFGLHPDATLGFVKSISELRNLKLKGLMTIGPFLPNPEDSRPAFRILRELRHEIEQERIENVEMRELSMGMTNDFEVAIEEGATIIRLGTAIFGPRKRG
jgi:pyridoxal phosphate enzyme (YggS family)